MFQLENGSARMPFGKPAMRRNPGDAYNAWSRNAFTSPAALVGESGKR